MSHPLLGQNLVGTKVILFLENPLIMFALASFFLSPATPTGSIQDRSLMVELWFLAATFLKCFSYNPGSSSEPQVSWSLLSPLGGFSLQRQP